MEQASIGIRELIGAFTLVGLIITAWVFIRKDAREQIRDHNHSEEAHAGLRKEIEKRLPISEFESWKRLHGVEVEAAKDEIIAAIRAERESQ